MRNKIITITQEEARTLIEKCKDKNIFTAELFGDKICELEDFFRDVSKAFKFPDLFNKYRNMDAYLDWIRDLSWLTYNENYEGFALFIFDYEIFMRNNYRRKEQIIREFAETVLPYWEEDVIRCTDNGQGTPRPFNLYLIDYCK